MKLTIRRVATLSAFLSMTALTAACGKGDDDTTGGDGDGDTGDGDGDMGGAAGDGDGDTGDGDGDIGDGDGDTGDGDGDLSAELTALQEQLDDLKQQLQDALDNDNQDLIDSLQTEIDDLQGVIDEITADECGQGGECTGLPDATEAITQLVSAMCEHLYGCCDQSEVRFALGPAVNTAEECTTVVVDRLARNVPPTSNSFYASFNFSLEIPAVDDMAASLEAGNIELDQTALAACVAHVNATECTIGKGEPGEFCGPADAGNPCAQDRFVTGLLSEGATCDPSMEFDECVAGLQCAGPEGGVGTCLPAGAAGDACTRDDQCEGFCDERVNQCADLRLVGEDCEYLDPTFDRAENPVLTPCEEGSECSVVTHTCVSTCGESNCNDDGDCTADYFCDTDAFDGSRDGWSGMCAERGEIGDGCDGGPDCKSGLCSGDQCAAPCEDDSSCSADQFCDGAICQDMLDDSLDCDADNQCASGLCVNARCQSPSDVDGYCATSPEEVIDGNRLCPAGQFCSYYAEGYCADLIPLDGDCSAEPTDLACDAGLYCAPDSTCQPRTIERGGDCAIGGQQQIDDEPAQLGCVDGLMCAGYSDGTDDVYVCLPPRDEDGARDEGEYCGPNQNDKSGARCVSGRCRLVNEFYGVCDAGKDDGEDCDAEASWDAPRPQQSYHDECQQGSYCKRDDVTSDTDYSGICTPKVVGGGVCDGSQPQWLRQCAGDNTCYSVDGQLRCPESESTGMCPVQLD